MGVAPVIRDPKGFPYVVSGLFRPNEMTGYYFAGAFHIFIAEARTWVFGHGVGPFRLIGQNVRIEG
jgi:hypothetical protein